MSLIVPGFTGSVVVRHAEAELISQAPTTIRLLADASSTGGALSTQRVTLTNAPTAPSPIITPTPPSCSTCSTAPPSCCPATRS